MSNDIIGLDFETYGGVDLPKHGLDRYASDPTCRVLIASTFRMGSGGREVRRRFDFVQDYHVSALQGLIDELGELSIGAHNAPFEQRMLRLLGISRAHRDFIDSAVVARAAGAAGKLEAAAPQLLDVDKLEQGKHLMRLFSLPGKYQEANGTLEFDPLVVKHNPLEWDEYGRYCDIDAELGWRIANAWGHVLSWQELENQVVTHEMNDVGWPVDVGLVQEMQRRYLDNQAKALAEFRAKHEAHLTPEDIIEGKALNFASFPQLKKWCEMRGVKCKSFDEEHVTMYLARIRKRIETHGNTMKLDQLQNLMHVKEMLTTKQILGGSSLKKLQAILDQVGPDDRLRGQYLHIGAGQSWRTSGRGVQLQNLKRLAEVKDMDELEDEDTDWTNEELARNLRQVFTASHDDGALIVGDLSSIESRGLAYLAGAEWKLQEFRNGKDMYKVLAARIDGCAYDAVTKDRRQFGKVGELSCGYQAGGGAVQSFAKKMGTMLTEGEANQLVSDWRLANPEVVELWEILDSLLHQVVDGGIPVAHHEIGNGMRVQVTRAATPMSLIKLHKDAVSIEVQLIAPNQVVYLRRFFHGCYMRGRNVCFYKPTEKKSGDVWVNHYRDPKTGEIRFYSLYGGKLAGILTQSMCREMFFTCLRKLNDSVYWVPNLQIIGQFHDEIVLDWWPDRTTSSLTLEQAENLLKRHMSNPDTLIGFPMAAEVKHDYRYTK
jgi:DNA polymerase